MYELLMVVNGLYVVFATTDDLTMVEKWPTLSEGNLARKVRV